jgi:hypothetical protein
MVTISNLSADAERVGEVDLPAVFAIAALDRIKCLFLWLFWVPAAMLSACSKYTSVDLTPRVYIPETSGKSI